MLALFVSLGGTSFVESAVTSAARLITGKQVKNNSLTGVDVRNGSLRPEDFSGSIKGEAGPQGPAGPKGDPGKGIGASCSAGSSIRAVNDDGGVTCQQDTAAPGSDDGGVTCQQDTAAPGSDDYIHNSHSFKHGTVGPQKASINAGGSGNFGSYVRGEHLLVGRGASGGHHPTGSILSPLWDATTVLEGAAGPLPLEGDFTAHGGTLLITVSGTGYRSTAQGTGLMCMEVTMQRVSTGSITVVGEPSIWANEVQSHKALPSLTTLQSTGSGDYKLKLNAGCSGGRTMSTDAQDRFYATVQELPF